MDVVTRAELFAVAAHRAIGHRRKYTGECYTVHLREVAELVAQHGGTPPMVAAAWLHDVVEDTHVTQEDVAEWFDPEVSELVDWLTDVSKPEDGNRALRKAMDRDHLARAPKDAQTIKYCDLISNARSIAKHDRAFAKVFLREKAELLAVMDKGDAELRRLAMSGP